MPTRNSKVRKSTFLLIAIAILIAIGVTVFFLTNTKEPVPLTSEHQGPNTQAGGLNPGDKTSTVAPISSIAPTGTPTPTPTPAPIVEKVDIVLIGSEMEGLYLARAAADEGLKVLILDPRPEIGGQILEAEMLFLDETKDEQGRSLVQGRMKALFDGFKNGKIRKKTEYVQYFQNLTKDIRIESGITLDSVNATAGKLTANAIQSIAYTTRDKQKKVAEAQYWVENTDHAAMTSKLKVTRLPGLEAFYGKDSIEYMSAGFMMKFKGVDWNKFNTHFNSLSSADRSKIYGGGYVNESFAIGLTGITNGHTSTHDRIFLRGLNAVYQRDGEVLINALLLYTIDPSDPQSIEEGLEMGRKEMPLILDRFRKTMVGWENAELNGFPDYLYIREYDHYETDYVLKPSDMLGGKMFWDNVSIAGYPLDLQGISISKWGIEMGRPDKYGMPLRSFLLRDYDNVIMAGKNVGSSAIAYGSARIQPNTGLAAESIGVILGQIQGKKQLREVKEEDMKIFHTYLETKYGIKLTGFKGTNKIAGWTADEMAKLDTGEIVYPAYIQTRKAPK